MLPHKTELERHLRQRYGELFAADFDVLLYDLTSSYVEGQASKNAMMQRGFSRDHRSDCKQVVLALIVNVEGFPLSYETLDGDRADVSTLGRAAVVGGVGPAVGCLSGIVVATWRCVAAGLSGGSPVSAQVWPVLAGAAAEPMWSQLPHPQGEETS